MRKAVDEQITPQRGEGSADCYCDGPPQYLKTLPKETKCTQRLYSKLAIHQEYNEIHVFSATDLSENKVNTIRFVDFSVTRRNRQNCVT
jgi:hypothetical protein